MQHLRLKTKVLVFTGVLSALYGLTYLFQGASRRKVTRVPKLSPLTEFSAEHQALVNNPFGFSENGTFEEGIEFVMPFPYLLDSTWNGTGYGYLSRFQRELRQQEFVDSLQNTLNHPVTARVHLLIDQAQIKSFLRYQFLRNYRKVRFEFVTDSSKMSTAFDFVSHNLLGRVVAVMNADIYPGRGFERLNFTRFKAGRTMYALSRHGRSEALCNMAGERCDDGVKYGGSHDAYVFVLHLPLPYHALRVLDHNVDAYGIDQITCWIFKRVLRYKVLNPCKVLHVYHNHCSNLRSRGKKRVNNYRNTVFVPFTADLF